MHDSSYSQYEYISATIQVEHINGYMFAHYSEVIKLKTIHMHTLTKILQAARMQLNAICMQTLTRMHTAAFGPNACM